MPIKFLDIPQDSCVAVNVGEQINMDTFFINSQDSLGLIDTCELFKVSIEQNLMDEIMKTTVNNESEEINVIIDNRPTFDEIKDPLEMVNDMKNSPPTGTIPSQEDFTGPYGFDLHMLGGSHGRGSYVYSPLLRQVFIGMNNILMMGFKTTTELDSGFFIRSLLMYTCDDFVCEPVVRCASHALEDDPRQEAHARGEEDICRCANFKNVGHVMRCSLSDAEYCYDKKSERHSVRVPIRQLQAGTEFIKVPYSFSCKTSCPRGMQRKPVQIVFTLETDEGIVFGRKVLPVKICSCPKRDKDRQERDFKKAQQLQSCSSGSKRIATSNNTTHNINDGLQPPPLKSIKLEDNFEESQNEEEKQKHRRPHSNTNAVTSSLDHDLLQRLVSKVANFETLLERIETVNKANFENLMERIENVNKETNERLERIEYALSVIIQRNT